MTIGVGGGVNAPDADFPFANIAKRLSNFQSINNTDAWPGTLDTNNYPTSSPSISIGGTLYFFPTYTGNYVIRVTGSGDIQLARGSPGFTVVSDPGSCVTGGTTSNLTITSACTNPRVVFQCATSACTGVTLAFLAGGTFSGLSNLIICRAADEAAVLAGGASGIVFNADYIAQLRQANPHNLRFLAWNDVNDANNFGKHAYRTPLTALTWANARWEPQAWAGTTSGTDTYTVAQPSTAITLVQGDTIQVRFANANLTTTPTLKVGSLAAKTITDTSGTALVAGAIAANSSWTLTYDAILGEWMGTPGGLTAYVPIEVMVALCNQIGAGCWVNIPHLYSDASMTAVASYVSANLNSSLNFTPEYSNEVWNFASGFQQTTWAANRGAVFGFPSANNEQFYGVYGLRFAQMMTLMEAAWSPRLSSTLVPAEAVQAFGPTSATQTYRLNGADLSTSLGYTGYNSLIGQNYNTAPNRPIDHVIGKGVLSYADYFSGAQTRNFDANYDVGNISNLLTQADNYATGTPTQQAAALTWMDNDFRNGTDSLGAAGGQTLAALAANIYPGWDTIAGSYSSPIPVWLYEGNFEGNYPGAGVCTTLSINSNYCGATGRIANLLNAYKATDAFRQLVNDAFRQFLASSHSKYPAQLLLNGGSQWAVGQTNLYGSFWQSWIAIQNFNTGGFLLNRDLNPASNDNSPVGLGMVG